MQTLVTAHPFFSSPSSQPWRGQHVAPLPSHTPPQFTDEQFTHEQLADDQLFNSSYNYSSTSDYNYNDIHTEFDPLFSALYHHQHHHHQSYNHEGLPCVRWWECPCPAAQTQRQQQQQRLQVAGAWMWGGEPEYEMGLPVKQEPVFEEEEVAGIDVNAGMQLRMPFTPPDHIRPLPPHVPLSAIQSPIRSVKRSPSPSPLPAPSPITPSPPPTPRVDLKPIPKKRALATSAPHRDSKKSRPHICPTCFRAFHRRFNMTIHQATHNPRREKQYTCTIPRCKSRFWRMPDLRRHLRTVEHPRVDENCDQVESD
ncbi:hypothetical protein PhCBS80983_g03294 [Powellomyces hirtus]|uniref:C2H2-type domain-containing protein n=1 Tax=Powellomyces hirtus TaxID=109895 RepID=A0A507E2Y5_9FUNG|nr:hypothetical protein PhCBS80983_g03294 [Powellomyces hirtus]